MQTAPYSSGYHQANTTALPRRAVSIIAMAKLSKIWSLDCKMWNVVKLRSLCTGLIFLVLKVYNLMRCLFINNFVYLYLCPVCCNVMYLVQLGYSFFMFRNPFSCFFFYLHMLLNWIFPVWMKLRFCATSMVPTVLKGCEKIHWYLLQMIYKRMHKNRIFDRSNFGSSYMMDKRVKIMCKFYMLSHRILANFSCNYKYIIFFLDDKEGFRLKL